jgi:hypothetical protein
VLPIAKKIVEANKPPISKLLPSIDLIAIVNERLITVKNTIPLTYLIISTSSLFAQTFA